MNSPYRRRKPSLIRNLWIYRYVIAIAFVMGVLLWFVVINNAEVQVYFPFGMGSLTSTAGIVILLSAIVGAVLAMMAMGLIFALRRLKAGASTSELESEGAVLDDDLPPTDYASKAPEGLRRGPLVPRSVRRRRGGHAAARPPRPLDPRAPDPCSPPPDPDARWRRCWPSP